MRLTHFVEFCKNHNIPIDEKSLQSRLLHKKSTSLFRSETKGGEKLSAGDINYVLKPERDYYRGVPTILNNELAAIVVAEKLA